MIYHMVKIQQQRKRYCSNDSKPVQGLDDGPPQPGLLRDPKERPNRQSHTKTGHNTQKTPQRT